MSIKTDFTYYLDHQDEMVAKYDGKTIVIKDGKVLGAYSSDLEAVRATVAQGHEPGSFLVQKCTPGPDAYTQRFHSRVAFA